MTSGKQGGGQRCSKAKWRRRKRTLESGELSIPSPGGLGGEVAGVESGVVVRLVEAVVDVGTLEL